MNKPQRVLFHLKNRIRNRKYKELPENWKQDLISLYIVRNSDGICLFSHHFQLGSIAQIETQLVGMGFTAISKMMREVVDASSRLILMDLGPKKVLIEEHENMMAILIVMKDLPFYRKKLDELINYFEKLFELQQQINLKTHVCLEDYALASELVSLIFSERSMDMRDIVPLVFKTIQKNDSNSIKSKYFSFKVFNNKKPKKSKNICQEKSIETFNPIDC
ncbi:MAG: hypothetical protein ACXACU_07555 [Candidatus Hodarchaeales archaeon]|jgi:hypothetical protein